MKLKKCKFIILIFIVFNCLNSQSMYLHKNEKRAVYSLAGNYYKFNSQEYSSYSLGLSYVNNANHEFELLYSKDSDDVKTINSYYKYYIKNNPYFNIFLGANHIYNLDNNDNSIYGYDYGYYFKIKFGDLIYYPFISKTEIENNEESSYTTIGVSILFNDVGIQPEYSKSNDGSTFYKIKFYLWEFR